MKSRCMGGSRGNSVPQVICDANAGTIDTYLDLTYDRL
jgi:hypothetical protein